MANIFVPATATLLEPFVDHALSGIRSIFERPTASLADIHKPPERVIKETGVPSIEEYPTQYKAFREILTLLQDDNNGVKCVALYGQRGVGKTTIMQHLNNHFHDSDGKLFDMVIFIKVSSDEKTKDLHILQQIADRIKVDKEGNNPDVVAGRIRKVLENKRYLLILDGIRPKRILDDIWEKLDISNDKRLGKVAITTHYPLLVKSKLVDRKVKIETLPPGDAWKMFRSIVGNNCLPDITTAQLVCKRFCCCLPLLINPIAKSFTDQESPPDWQRSLDEWTPWPQFEVEGLEELYSILEICYQLLGDQSRQKCFLYASLYPANSKIYTDYFVECCIAQGFLGVVNAATKYSATRSRGINVILRHLVNAAFLEEGEQMRYLKMNDLYRQLALHISSKVSDSECKTYVDNEEHDEGLRSASWQNARWVSMVGSKRETLPINQNYGSLQTLLLQKNPELVQISSDYFGSMGNLLVLNLYGTSIRELPSLSGLTSLKVFYINGCSDLKICSHEIQPLKHLEVFDIRGTGVNFVPCLKSLRCLRTSYIASGNYDEISKLCKLEELTIEVQDPWLWCDDAENIIQQVASLKNLTTFKCNFPFPKITLEQVLGKASIGWVKALIECTPTPQVGVYGLSPTEAWKMFRDIVTTRLALP